MFEPKYTPPNPTDLGLPHKLWWSGQREGVEQIIDLWTQGINTVMVNGPTGSGKSLVGTASAATWQQMHGEDLDVTILTQTKDLQQQYYEEFDKCEVATGRSNWNCGANKSLYANKCPQIMDGCLTSCPYRIQRDRARGAPIRAINYALYGATGSLFDGGIMVADEADNLGDLLVQANSVDLSRLVINWGLEVQQGFFEYEKLIQVIDDIASTTAVPEEQEDCKHALQLLKNKRYVVKGVGDSIIPYPEGRVVQDFVRGPTIIMSATVFAPQYWSKKWDIPIGWVELPCDTPVENRPIYLENVKRINNKTTEEEWVGIIEALDKIAGDMLDSEGKGVIHSVSNWLMDYILKYSKYKHLMIPAAGATRLSGIEKFKDADNGILIGPNLSRGINLPDELCRWIIIPKIPYPSLGDPRVQEIMKGGEEQYLVETLSTIIQQCGRGVRHRKDYCKTFILDSGAGYLFKQTSSWLPQWFREAIIYGGRK